MARGALAVAAVVCSMMAVPVPAQAESRSWTGVTTPAVFSPNGDGVKDKARVRIKLPRAAKKVRIVVKDDCCSSRLGPGRTVRKVRLGRLAAGTHSWKWDGRDQGGSRVVDGHYAVWVVSENLRPSSDDVIVDTKFRVRIRSERFGAPAGQVMRLYPRSWFDSLELGFTLRYEPLRTWDAEAVIRNSAGRRVFRADLQMPFHPTPPSGGQSGDFSPISWSATRSGRPLPPGIYTVTVRGRDGAGNPARGKPLKLEVMDQQLVWHEESFEVTPVESSVSDCFFTDANGCGDFPDYGTVVPSEIFPDGLSYRSAEGEDEHRSLAHSQHLLEVPSAAGVRGLEQARVSFAGRPTEEGEEDSGQLHVGGRPVARVSSSTGAQTDWVVPATRDGGSTRGTSWGPAVTWTFSTFGTDSFDVDRFTVDVRYYAPESS